jgi:hypothetical protein
MLDVTKVHPFEACASFAVRFLERLAAGDMAGAEALIDVNDAGGLFVESFPAPEGFSYAHPDKMESWTMMILGADKRGFRLDFEVRFADKKYRDRPMSARFEMRRKKGQLQVRLEGLVPS